MGVINYLKKNSGDPYRLFFSFGFFAAILSVLFWVFYREGLIDFYPIVAHRNLMFFGFFWAFITGFLMTAIPKMTKTAPAGFFEWSLSFIILCVQVLLNFLDLQQLSLAAFLFQILAVIAFGLPRVIQYGRLPFPGFVFIPVAFLQAMISIVLAISAGNRFQNLKIFWTEALVLNLIFGVGSRLIPVISRVKDAIAPDQPSGNDSWKLTIFALVTLNSGYWLEVLVNSNIGIGLRLLAIAFVAVYHFKIFSPRISAGHLGLMIRMSVALIFIGQILSIPTLGLGIAGSHVLFICGMLLLTLLISFRVILAHGKADINYELKGKKIVVVAVSLTVAAFARLAMSSNVNSSFFWVAILLFVFALAVWMTKFFEVTFSSKK